MRGLWLIYLQDSWQPYQAQLSNGAVHLSILEAPGQPSALPDGFKSITLPMTAFAAADTYTSHPAAELKLLGQSGAVEQVMFVCFPSNPLMHMWINALKDRTNKLQVANAEQERALSPPTLPAWLLQQELDNCRQLLVDVYQYAQNWGGKGALKDTKNQSTETTAQEDDEGSQTRPRTWCVPVCFDFESDVPLHPDAWRCFFVRPSPKVSTMLELLLHKDSTKVFRVIDIEDCLLDVVGFPDEGYNVKLSTKDNHHVGFMFFSIPEAFSFLLYISPPSSDSEQSLLITRLLQPLAVRKLYREAVTELVLTDVELPALMLQADGNWLRTNGDAHRGSVVIEVNGVYTLQAAAEDVEAMVQSCPADSDIRITLLEFPAFSRRVYWRYNDGPPIFGELHVEHGKVSLVNPVARNESDKVTAISDPVILKIQANSTTDVIIVLGTGTVAKDEYEISVKGFFAGVDIATCLAQASILLNECSPEVADALQEASAAANDLAEAEEHVDDEGEPENLVRFAPDQPDAMLSPSADILRKCGINSVEDIPTCATLSHQLDIVRDAYAGVTYQWLRFRRRHLHDASGPQDEPPMSELSSEASQAFHAFLSTMVAQPTLFLNVCLSLAKEQRAALLELFATDTLTEFAQDSWPLVHLLLNISKQVGSNADYTVDRSLLSIAISVCEIMCCRFEVRAFVASVAREMSEQWTSLAQCATREEMDVQGCRWLAMFVQTLQRALSLNRCPIVLCALFNILSTDAKTLGISPSYVVTNCLLGLCICCCVNLRYTMTALTADVQTIFREAIDSRTRAVMERLVFLATAFQGKTPSQRLSLTLYAQIASIQTAVNEFCTQAGSAWTMHSPDPTDDLVARAQSTLYHTVQHMRPQAICSTFVIHSGDLLALFETTREHVQKSLLLDSNRRYASVSNILEQCEPHTTELDSMTGFLRLENTWSKDPIRHLEGAINDVHWLLRSTLIRCKEGRSHARGQRRQDILPELQKKKPFIQFLTRQMAVLQKAGALTHSQLSVLKLLTTDDPISPEQLVNALTEVVGSEWQIRRELARTPTASNVPATSPTFQVATPPNPLSSLMNSVFSVRRLR